MSPHDPDAVKDNFAAQEASFTDARTVNDTVKAARILTGQESGLSGMMATHLLKTSLSRIEWRMREGVQMHPDFKQANNSQQSWEFEVGNHHRWL